MLKAFAIIVLILCTKGAIAQGPAFSINKDTVTYKLKKISGIGPAGNSSIGKQPKDEMAVNDEERKIFTLKNIPANLTDVHEFFLELNLFQSTYQSYVAGIYTKAFFIKRAKGYGWKLADTASLSRQPIRCAVALITGLDEKKDPVYILDANNNNDLADDVAKPLLKQVMDEDQVVSSANKVQVDYFSGKKLTHGDLMVYISVPFRSGPNQPGINLAFPEFAYQQFIYKDHAYILCTSGYQFSPFIVVRPDRPGFVSVSPSKRINVGQFFKLGDDDFKLLSLNDYSGEVVFTGNNVDGFMVNEPVLETEKPKTTAKNPHKILSTSMGYQAPLVSGINYNKQYSAGIQISTTALKGKYIYLDFWSTTCAPCIAEMPNIKEAYLKFKDKFEVLGILDERGKGTAQKLLKRLKLPWPNIIMDAKSTHSGGYGKINSFPTSYLLDADGKVVAINLRGVELIAKLSELIK